MKYNLRKHNNSSNNEQPPPVTESFDEGSDNESYVPETKKQKKSDRMREKDIEEYRKIFKNYSRIEETYYEELSVDEQNFIINRELRVRRDKNILDIPLRFKILTYDMDDSIKLMLFNRIDKLNKMSIDHSEYYKLKNWIDNVSMIPFNKYCEIPISKNDPCEKIVGFMNNTRKILDDTVYGHIDAKQHIMRIIAQWISNPTSQGYCIGIHGPPGIGKTCLIKDGLSKALDIPFGFVPLGGATDGCFLDGHSYTYEGSTYGKIVEILMKTRCMNPIIFFDELDKVSFSTKGNEITGILTHLTDISQNDQFNDKYFSELRFNLSRSLIVFSYNDESLINPILKDRMITIRVNGYNNKDKLIIAKDYLLPKIFKTFQIDKDNIIITDTIIEKIITMVPNEDGVRNLKRGIESIIGWINMYLYTKEVEISYPFEITEQFLQKHITKSENKDTAMINRMYL